MSDLSKASEQQTSFFTDLLREIEGNPYGSIQFEVKTHRGLVTSVTSNEFRAKKFDEGENAVATAELLAMIKNMVDRRDTGTLSFTISFRNGAIRELINQFYNKKVYQGK